MRDLEAKDTSGDVLRAMAEATELWIVTAECQIPGMSWTVVFAGTIATNVGRRDTTLKFTGICRGAPSPHNNDQEDEILVALRPKIAIAMQVSQRKEEKEAETRMDALELKTGKNIKVLIGVRIDAKIKDNLPVMYGMVGNKNLEVLRDSGCTKVIVKEELADEADFIAKVKFMMSV